MSYNHKKIDKKWQEFWDQNQTFKAEIDNDKEKYYSLDMFPYPSGAGLHVGHPEGYTATDIVSRFKRANNFNVLHPMGWDAFGLPAEQYALKNKKNPSSFTQKNIENFKNQIKSLGLSYDWNSEINTSDPSYYKWTQWIFEQLYKKGLAYEDEILVNWAPDLDGGTVLANEEVINGKSERGGFDVYRTPMRQWVLRITKYADRLIDDLDEVDWPERIKQQQKNWIGRSRGSEISFEIKNSDEKINVFTTKPEDIFGVTYLVVSPENSIVDDLIIPSLRDEFDEFKKEVSKQSDLERTSDENKIGMFTGSYAVNPVNGKEIPIWIGNYVLNSYATGSVMGVPGSDERDLDFSKKYNLPIIEIFSEDKTLINSDFLDGLSKKEAREVINNWLSDNKIGFKTTVYRLHDWIFSRQRYWGEPIPVIHWEDGTTSLVPENELPLTLPMTDNIRPSGNGESPLKNIDEWVNVVRDDGVKGKRDTNTMPQWAGSSWYYLRYTDPKNDKKLADENKINYWMNVDLYIGGAEHAVLHLLYARFWHKFLYDLGIVKDKEPFKKLVNQGMILGENHEKMSKSKGNVINPDDIVEEYGADALRVFEMFLGPLSQNKPWSTDGLTGSKRFLDKIYRTFINEESENLSYFIKNEKNSLDTEILYNQTVKKVTEDIENLRFNTAISQLQIFINEVIKDGYLNIESAKGYIQLLAPFAPHLAEELWSKFNISDTISYQPWPTFDPEKLESKEVVIPIQVNGKVKTKISVDSNLSKDEFDRFVLENQKVKDIISGKEIKRTISVPNKIVNFII